jgi:hypothetical protein
MNAQPRSSFEQHFNCLIGRRNITIASTESGIGPIENCRRMPLRRAILISINNANAASACPLRVVHRPENPISRPAHLYHRLDAFAGNKRKHIDRGACRHWISVESDHGKAVTWQMQVNLIRTAGMNKPEPNLLAGSYADRRPVAERFVTNRDEDFPTLNQGREGGSAHRRASSSGPGPLKEASAFHCLNRLNFVKKRSIVQWSKCTPHPLGETTWDFRRKNHKTAR